MSTCPKCGRPIGDVHGLWADQCQSSSMGSRGVCAQMAAAYRRGMRDCLAIAKGNAYAEVDARDGEPRSVIDWSDVDAELAKKMEG